MATNIRIVVCYLLCACVMVVVVVSSSITVLAGRLVAALRPRGKP